MSNRKWAVVTATFIVEDELKGQLEEELVEIVEGDHCGFVFYIESTVGKPTAKQLKRARLLGYGDALDGKVKHERATRL